MQILINIGIIVGVTGIIPSVLVSWYLIKKSKQ